MQPMEAREPGDAPMSEARRLSGVFHEPGAVFADIAANGRWWLALLIVVVVTFSVAALMASHIGYDRIIQKSFESNSRLQEMPAEQKARAIETQRKIMPFIMHVVPAVSVVIGALVIAGVLLFIMNAMLDAGLTFKQVLNIQTYASLPASLVGGAALVLVLFLKSPDEFDVQRPLAFNAGAFLNPDTSAKWLQSLLGSFDLFTIWTIVLLAIGFSAACGQRKMPFSRALTGILVPWGIWVLGKAAVASLFG